ncbi:MAG: aldehyde dehydrogenase family protein [Sphingomonas sp.]
MLASAAETLKRVTLELGGNDPAIVLEDADLDAAAAGIARSGFYNAGQICMAVKRVYAAASIHDALVERLKERVAALKVGRAMCRGWTWGRSRTACNMTRWWRCSTTRSPSPAR